jgi:hypothetical protein
MDRMPVVVLDDRDIDKANQTVHQAKLPVQEVQV